MAKYHIHPVTGNPTICRAHKKCPFGDMVKEHFNSPAEARKLFEERMKLELHTKNKIFTEFEHRAPNHFVEISENLTNFSKELKHHDLSNAMLIFVKNLKQARTRTELLDIQMVNKAFEKRITPGNGEYREMLALQSKIVRDISQYIDEYELKEINLKALKDYQQKLDVCTSSQEKYLLEQKQRIEKIIAARKYSSKNFDEIKRNELLNKINQNLDAFSQQNFNKFYADGEVIETVGHEAQVVKTYEKVREILDGGVNDDHEIIVGEISNSDKKKAIKEISYIGEQLLGNILKEDQLQPEPISLNDKNKTIQGSDFVALGSGNESNAYLHKPTNMVYKIYHQDSLKNKNLKRNMTANEMQTIVATAEAKYNKIDHQKLSEENAEYVPTYFITSNFSDVKIPMIVQPYLNPDLYVPASGNEKFADPIINDVNSGNLSINVANKKLVLFDCIF